MSLKLLKCTFVICAAAMSFDGIFAVASAAQPVTNAPSSSRATAPQISLSDVTPTPEMWIYSQERQRYEDPKAAVRRKAEFRAQQRQKRIASMKAFGMSKQRPTVYNSPFHSYFGQQQQWLTIRPPVIVQRNADDGESK